MLVNVLTFILPKKVTKLPLFWEAGLRQDYFLQDHTTLACNSGPLSALTAAPEHEHMGTVTVPGSRRWDGSPQVGFEMWFTFPLNTSHLSWLLLFSRAHIQDSGQCRQDHCCEARVVWSWRKTPAGLSLWPKLLWQSDTLHCWRRWIYPDTLARLLPSLLGPALPGPRLRKRRVFGLEWRSVE